MELRLDIQSPSLNIPDVLKTEKLSNQEKTNTEKEADISSGTVTLSVRGKNIAHYILESAHSNIIDKKDLISAVREVEELWGVFTGLDEDTSKTLASAFLRLSVEGMPAEGRDKGSIWRETIEVRMADISLNKLADAWEEKTKEMGLEHPFELSKEELLSVVSDLTKGKELKMMNYVKKVADSNLTGIDKEIYLQAHETLFRGAITEEEKLRLMAEEEGIVDPQDFVVILKLVAASKNKDVANLSKDEIIEIVKADLIVFEGAEDSVSQGIIDDFFYFDFESLRQITKEEAIKMREEMEEKTRAKLKEMLKEIAAKMEGKEKGETSKISSETSNDAMANQEGLVDIPQKNFPETNNDSLKGDTLTQENSVPLEEYSRITDYFETNGASLDPNWVDITDEASSLLFIPPRTPATHYIDAVQ
ncbi:MAG: hypothetical protein AB1797_00320 [bacterium]